MTDLLALLAGGDRDLRTILAGTWAEPARGAALALDLERRIADATAAFAPDDPAKAWLVLSGGVDVFHLDGAAGGDPADARRGYLLTVGAGGLLAGIGAPEARRLLAVPSNQAELAELAASRLELGADSGPGAAADAARPPAAAVAALWEGWLERAAAAAAPPLPADTVVVKAGQPVAAKPGDALQAGGAPLWLPPDLFQGGGGAPPPPSHRRLVTRSLCAVAAAAGAARPIGVAEWLATPDWREDLKALDLFLGERFAAAAARRAEAQAALDAAVARHSADLFGESLREMAQVLRVDAPPAGEVDPEPFAAAAALVCDRVGARRKPRRVRLPPGARPADAAQLYARAQDIQARAVALEGRWWSSDHGALLVLAGPDKRPCALLPERPGAYRLVDPAAAGADPAPRVTAKVAATVDPQAFAFFADLPTDDLGPWRIFRFGFRGGYRDARNLVWTMVLGGFLGLAVPVATGWIMDPVIPEAQTGQLAVLISALLVIGVSLTAFTFVQSLSMLRLESHMDNRVQGAVWVRLLNLPASFFRGYTVGDLANRASGINGIRGVLTGTVNSSLAAGVSGLFSLLLIVWYDWRLSLVGLLVAGLYCAVIYLVGRRILARNRESMALTGRLQGLVLQLLGAVAKLRVAGAERRAFARWSGVYLESVLVGLRQRRLNNRLIVFKAVVQQVAVIAALAVIGFEAGQLLAFFRTPTGWPDLVGQGLRAAMPTASFVAFNVAYAQFLGAVFGLTQTAVEVLNVKPLWERVTPVVRAAEETHEGAVDPGDIEGDIEVANVRFRYAAGGPLVLRGLSLKVPHGRFVAIAGPSGAGKSSLVRLLLGFEQPEAGSILIDGMDLRWLDKRAVRRRFGVVLQNGRLLAGSIQDNIAAGAAVSRDEVMLAARMAGLDKDIEAMPMGLQTVLSEGAATLSGGQRQRLMIARAIVRRPRVLIFDEATSALDNETQAEVSRNLESLGCTRLVIAHRLSTIVHADLIYVIEQGQVVEQGAYLELMAKNGAFAALAKRQIA